MTPRPVRRTLSPATARAAMRTLLAGAMGLLRAGRRGGNTSAVVATVPPLRLQQKAALAVGVTLATLFVVLYLVSSFIIHEGFARLERREASKDVNRVLLALGERGAILESSVQDWAYWDDTYGFVQDRNETYVKANLNPESLSILRIQLLSIVDSAGDIVWGGASDPEDPDALLSADQFDRLWGDLLQSAALQKLDGARSGILLHDQHPLLVAASPILTSKQEGPARGYLLMGCFLDEHQTGLLAATLKMDLALLRADRFRADPERTEIMHKLLHGADNHVQVVDDQILDTYGVIRDLNGNPGLLVKVRTPRDIHQQARKTSTLFAAMFVLAGGAFVVSIVILMRSLVLRKLEHLSRDIHRITCAETFSEPIPWEGSDELADVARGLNRLLEAVTQSRRELVASEEYLSATLRSIGDGVIACDPAGRVTSLNSVAETLTGWTTAEAAGRPLEDVFRIVHAQTRQTADNPVAQALAEGVNVELANHTALIARNGVEHQIADSCAPIRDASGAVIGAVLVFRDVTEDYRRREELLETNRQLQQASARATELTMRAEQSSIAKSEFLANMSHEIRTPMTAILGFTELLSTECDVARGTEERLEAIQAIRRNGDYLLRLINDILDLSKIEAGKVEVELTTCSPAQVLDEVARLMRVPADAKGLPLELEFDGGVPESIRSDPLRLRQILINLVGNAVKFTETGSVRMVGRLLRLPGKPALLEVDVIDTGVGMTQEETKRLFRPFSQADSSTTRKFGGTGLGLTISKRLAEMLGGGIALSSEPGKGSTFRVTVETGELEGVRLLHSPFEAVPQVAMAATDSPVSIARFDGRILLAEDGPDNQRLISYLLKRGGAHVTVADNGQIAVDQALAARGRGMPFDVILMDMQMPVMDGYEATRRLRAAGYAGPVIALTAHAMAGDDAKCLDAGCDAYLTKPIDRATLLRTIARYGVPFRTVPQREPVVACRP